MTYWLPTALSSSIISPTAVSSSQPFCTLWRGPGHIQDSSPKTAPCGNTPRIAGYIGWRRSQDTLREKLHALQLVQLHLMTAVLQALLEQGRNLIILKWRRKYSRKRRNNVNKHTWTFKKLKPTESVMLRNATDMLRLYEKQVLHVAGTGQN